MAGEKHMETARQLARDAVTARHDGKWLTEAARPIATALTQAERDGMRRAEAQIEELQDKIDGLSSDLDNAVETAFKRGATEWTRLNYPAHFARLSQAGEDA